MSFDLATIPGDRVLARDHCRVYLAPPPLLPRVVAHYTITHPPAAAPLAAPGVLNLLPDVSGCIVCTLGRPIMMWGATTHVAQVSNDYSGAPMRFFIEFRPGGAHELLGLDMQPLANKMFALADVYPALEARLAPLLETADVGLLLRSVDALLADILLAGAGALERIPLALLGRGELLSVQDLSEKSGYSQRHLRRIFLARLGVGVKECLRVYRVNRALRLLRPGVLLTRAAQEAGYYDQSHFYHDFKAVCGISPSRYLADMSDFYKEEFKF